MYSGNTKTRATLHFSSGDAIVSASLFEAILKESRGKIIPDGFSTTDPTPCGLGKWAQSNSSLLNPVRLTLRHACFIAAVLVIEGLIRHRLRGNAVKLHF